MRARLLAGMGICALVLLGAGGGVAAAAPGKLRVVSPRASSVFTAAQAVSIRVGVPSRGRFTASVGTRPISNRFGRARKGVRTARLVVGRDLRLGSNMVRIHAGRASTSLQIVAAKRKRGLVQVRRSLGKRHGKECLCVRVTSKHRRHVPVGFEAMLNGRNVTNHFWREGARRRRAVLDSGMGLRHGRNTLAMLVFDADGHYDRETTSIVVPRTLPLASAGRHRRVRTRQRVRLNGTGSIPARRGRRLRYRWRIVDAPKGSDARLRRAHSARPVLVPDVRGKYRVRLTVRGAAGGRFRDRGRAAAASGSGVATAGAAATPSNAALPTMLPLSGANALSTLTRSQPPTLLTPPSQISAQQNRAEVTIAATPPISPMGWTIQTNPVPGRGAVLNGDPELPGGTVRTQGGVQLLVIDRGTLAVEQNRFFPAVGTDWQKLSDAVDRTNSTQLVMLSGIGLPASFDQAAIDSLGSVLGRIGADRPSGWGAGMFALRTGRWSAIGRVGLPAGSADERFAADGVIDAGAGNLSGHLQIDTTGSYVFVHGKYVSFDTSAPLNPPANANSIKVGDQVVVSETLPAGASGFHVVAVDAFSLTPRLTSTFVTNTSQGPDAQGIQRLAATLGRIAETPSWNVIVQSIGNPAVSPAWVRELAPQITRVGANWNVFNGLDGSGGYVLVGGAGADSEPVEQSGPLTGGPGQLSGILAPNHHARMVVAQSAVSDDYVTDLMPLAFSRGQAWPASSTAEQRKANAYIARQLGFSYSDVRDAYWRDPDGDFGGALLDQLRDVRHPGGNPGFSPDDFNAVQTALVREFRAVPAVRGMIKSWQNIFATASTSGLIDLHKVTQGVEDAIKPKPSAGISFDAMEMLSVVTEVGSLGGEAELVPGTGAAVSAYRLASTIASIASSAGGDVPVSERIQTTAGNLADSLSGTYVQIQASLDHVGDLLVSNYGILRLAAGHANDDWALSTQAKDQIRVNLGRSARQIAYGALLPIVYPYVYDLQHTNLNRSGTSAQDYRCAKGGNYLNPFKYTAADGAFMGIAGVDGNGTYIVDANVLSGIGSGDWRYDRTGRVVAGIDSFSVIPNLNTTPPGELLEPLFVRVAEGGQVGLYPQYFFHEHFTPRPVACTT